MRRLFPLLCIVLAGAAQAQVYKCEVGERTVYQETPCARSEQARVMQERMTVVDPYPYRLAEPTPRSVRTAPTRSASAEQAGEHPSCQSLRDRIRRIDAAARQRSTQRLREQRWAAKQELSALGCAEMEPR